MVKIGNIVNYGQIKIELDHFHTWLSLDEIDNELPTLLVGYSNTKKIFGELNFFDKKLDHNLFWTLNRGEDRYNFNRDLGIFIEYCESKLTDKFEYLFINPFELSLNQIKRFLRHLKSEGGLVISDGPMMYIWAQSRTYGFHTEFGELFGVDRDHIVKFLLNNNYRILGDKEVEAFEINMGEIEYDLVELLFFRENFAL
jgi:hypothetical protein